MLKYVLVGLFILILSALFQHPIPILEDIEVYPERYHQPDPAEKQGAIEVEFETHPPQQANIEANPDLFDYQLNQAESPLVSVTSNTH